MSKAKTKTVTANIKLLINAGQAKPAPPVGPALGQAGLNIMSFCKDFNAKTADIRDNVPVPVKLTAFSDKSFIYTIKTPPAMYFIKKAIGLAGGSQKPGHTQAGEISAKSVYEIAKIKHKDQPRVPLESVAKSVAATCSSMGIKVIGLSLSEPISDAPAPSAAVQ